MRLGSFELDLKTGELCACEGDSVGRRVLLQEQPFRVLVFLVECGGGLASREEIRRRLWPNDTVVDFDHNINVAIGTLRRAFGDSAAQPSYIETVARRGYRLVVPAEWIEPIDDPPQFEAKVSPFPEQSEVLPASSGLIGKKVSHFRVIEMIGGGGMGVVYRAEDLKLSRPVALKFLPEELASDPAALKRFEREAKTASSLNHPNICTIFTIEEFGGQPLIVMELLNGLTLRDRLAADHPTRMPLDQFLEIAIQICDGLQAAHERGIVHRDIKPANIFLTNAGPAKILDFGLAKLVESEEQTEMEAEARAGYVNGSAGAPMLPIDDTNLTRTGLAMGTASYMSPEQIRTEKLDARTDLFSFGLVLYEMATGARAFTGNNATGIHEATLHRTPIPVHDLNPTVPGALEAVIAKAMSKDRAQRYQSAAEMRADIELVRGQRKLRMHRIRKWLGLAVLLLVFAGGADALYRYLTRYQLTATDTIVIADLTNQTSDTVLDDALNLAIPVELSQTPFLQVLAQDKVRETMKDHKHPVDGKITPEIAREVCLQTNSKAVIDSSIADVGNHFQITLTGVNCRSGKIFARAKQVAPLRTDIVHALGLAGAELRGRMGEPAESVNRFNTPLELATSSSLEAIQSLHSGFKIHLSGDHATTASYYERAVDLDPNFALAYASLGIIYRDVGRAERALAAEKKAYELRDRLTGQLKFLAETLYLNVGLGDLDSSYPIYQEWVRTFPLDGVAHINFAACLLQLGRYDESAAEEREALRLMPLLGPGSYYELMTATVSAGHLEEAKLVYAQAKARKEDSPSLRGGLFLVAFLQHNKRAMEEQFLQARGDNISDPSFRMKGRLEAYGGRFTQARQLLQQAVRAPKKNNALDQADPSNLEIALDEAEVGQKADAARRAKQFSLMPQDRGSRQFLALLLAFLGDGERAAGLATALDRESPQDTLSQRFILPTIRAAIQLNNNNPERAIEILRPLEKYELAYTQSFDNLYPAYIRGLAYLQLGSGREAAAEFQKLIDRPAIVKINVIGALAYLQLGRSDVLMGDKVAARKSYQAFLTIWKDADPDVPVLMQAKAEYARLGV